MTQRLRVFRIKRDPLADVVNTDDTLDAHDRWSRTFRKLRNAKVAPYSFGQSSKSLSASLSSDVVVGRKLPSIQLTLGGPRRIRRLDRYGAKTVCVTFQVAYASAAAARDVSTFTASSEDIVEECRMGMG